MCGGPAVDRTIAGRVMIATAIAIRTVLKIAPRIALKIVLKRARRRRLPQMRLTGRTLQPFDAPVPPL